MIIQEEEHPLGVILREEHKCHKAVLKAIIENVHKES
jgi:hypothetical protein